MPALFPIRLSQGSQDKKKEVLCSHVRPAYGEYLRGWFYFDPAISLDYGTTRIVGIRGFVGNPANYDGQFKFGDRILIIHFFSRDAKESLKLLRQAGKYFPLAKEAGYKGAYGDTTNNQLIRMFMKHFESVTFDPPFYKNIITRSAVILLALWNVMPTRFLNIGYGIPLQRIGGKFKRIVMRF